MPSQVNASNPTPSHRTKVTLACDGCRKRRIKCSGTFPCSTCVEAGNPCVFDDKHRGRRGPRARRPSQRIVHELAPATTTAPIPSLAHQASTTLRSARPDPRDWFNERSANPSTASVIAIKLSDAVASNSDVDEEAASLSSLPEASKWMAGLEGLFLDDQSIATDPMLNIDLMLHLLELFYNHTSALVEQILPASHFFQALASGTAFRGLILAVCASSVRFSTHRSARPPAGDGLGIASKLARLARASVDFHGHLQLDQIRTICVLIDYEASISHGRIAWVDLATGKSLTQLYRANTRLTREESQVLDLVDYFLAVTVATHCLGNPSLQPFEVSSDRRGQADNADPAPCSSSKRLLYLIRFLSRIQRLRAAPSGRQKSLPWKPDSDFRVLHHELEAQQLHHPHTPYSEADISQEPTEKDDLTSLFCSLVCSCCDIELNKAFLPIPLPLTDINQETGATPPCINFPEAPTLFLVERLNRCESAAEATCRSARDVIGRGGFFQYMLILGYCCMQSSFVLINQLHRGLKPPDPKVVENLRLVFMVVAGVSKFYAQGKGWLNIMFRVYDVNTPLKQASSSLGGAFGGYFSRFKDLCEPCCVPLDPCAIPEPPMPEGPHNGGMSQYQEPAQDAQGRAGQGSSWAADYAGHLAEYISDEDTEQGPDMSADGHTPMKLAQNGRPGPASSGVNLCHGNVKEVRLEQGKGKSPGEQPTTAGQRLSGISEAVLTGVEDGQHTLFGESSALFTELFQPPPDLTTFLATGTGNGTDIDLGLQSLLDLDDLFADEDWAI
ncbi:hypothetical protein ACJZ2D_010055 [Fusarium nematophilum]